MKTQIFTFIGLLAASTLAQAAHPLDGRVWDTRSKNFISAQDAYDQAAASRHLLLGEKHDSGIHHRLQLEALEAIARKGGKRTLAMEQFDRENQPALNKAQAAGVTDPEKLADAGGFNRNAWQWPMYRDLIASAANRGWPLAAANLSRDDAREIAMGRTAVTLPDIDSSALSDLEEDIVIGHCGHRPPQERLTSIVNAQRARDARMAETLDASPIPTVLIAGAGHVRRDRAVPRYLKDPKGSLTIAYVETAAGKETPEAYDHAGFDLLWFTPRTERADPCGRPLSGPVVISPNPVKEKKTP